MSVETPGGREDELLTVNQVAERFHVSRQTVHNLRVRGAFPAPEPTPGSTRPRWRESVVAAYFKANPPRPGARTDLTRAKSEELQRDDQQQPGDAGDE